MEIDIGSGTIQNFDSTEFSQIIGSGGFGLIIKSEKQNYVVKALYKSHSCTSAKTEFEKHKKIYKRWQLYSDDTTVPKPIGFSTFGTTFKNKYFNCFYLMDFVESLQVLGLVHIILKDEYENIFNKSIGKIYSEPISKTNPSRGYFATKSGLTDILKENKELDLDILSFKMGEIFGTIVFGAEYNPIDVEYLLSKDFKMTALDFGQVEKLNFKPEYILKEQKFEKLNMLYNEILDNSEIDLYIPDREDKLYIPFCAGVSKAFFFFSKLDVPEIRLNKLYVFRKFLP
jgi:hypothetical protein